MTITWQDFEKVDIRIGTIVKAEIFPEARKPAFILHVDFGSELGIKKSSSQITDLYSIEQLNQKQVMAVINFEPKQVGPIMSECLVLGFYRKDNSVVLATNDLPSKEDSKYCPNSPYSASKASSDHFVRAFNVTYGLPTIITNCSNNYGPYQFPEKLIPLIINNALNGNPLPIYGDGLQIRDWIYVEDHVDAISIALNKGKQGETYNIGGSNELKNIDVVQMVCNALDSHKPLAKNKSYFDQVKFIKDRPGHDQRYAIDSSKINKEFEWKASVTIESGIDKTVKWYLDNRKWLDEVVSGEYMNWVKSQYN